MVDVLTFPGITIGAGMHSGEVMTFYDIYLPL